MNFNKNYFKKIVILIAFLAILVLPNFSSAMTPDELNAQIEALIKQIQQLQQQLAQLEDQTQPWCYTFNTNLKIGMLGSEVEALQIALEKEGFIIGSDEKNNKEFDESTASAVSGFQEKYKDEILTPLGLKYPTGYTGPKTRAKLNQLYGCIIKENQPPVIKEVSGPTVLKVNETGTWTIKTSDPEQGTLTYSVVWGDEPETITRKRTAETFIQTATLTHSYSKPGIYTPTFTVKDNQGLTAQTSISVKVEVGIVQCIPVKLAPDNPLSTTIISGQSTADLLHLVFSNPSGSNLNFKKMILKRIGLSSDNTLENVYLFDSDGITRLTEKASISQNNITFFADDGIFTIPAQSSKKIIVKADISKDSVGQTVGVKIESAYNIDTGSSVNVCGTYPIVGNIMSIAPADLAKVDLIGNNFGPHSGNVFSGTNVEIWGGNRAINVSTRNVVLKYLTLIETTGTLALIKLSGDYEYGDITNFRLFIDGVESSVNDVQNLGNKFVIIPTVFPTLVVGSHSIHVIVYVSSNTQGKSFSFSLRNSADIELMDAIYGVNVQPTVDGNDFIPITSGIQAIITSHQPFITGISPTFGMANDIITIYGKNLVDTIPSGIRIEFLKNGVVLGAQRSQITTSPDGLSLKFQLSGILVENSTPGLYQIRVVNDNGESNTVDFTMSSSQNSNFPP